MTESSFYKHYGSKIFKHSDAIPLAQIKEILSSKEFLINEEPDLDDRRKTKVLRNPIKVNLNPNLGLFGTLVFKKQEYDSNDDYHYEKPYQYDFIFCEEPNVLILHGSRTLMDKVKGLLEKELYPNNKDGDNPDDDDRDPYFNSYAGTSPTVMKYIIKKITKVIEAYGNKKNILFDPHFKQLGANKDVRGGECFWRRDGVSATQDDRFCYLFELCTFWEPELMLYNCAGILSPSNNIPIKLLINRDLSFSFSHGIPKDQLDTFWFNLILPIIREDNYEQEKKECVDDFNAYSKKIESAR